MNRIRTLAQVVGFVTMGLLALYGLLVLSGVAGPLGLTAEADAEMLNTANEAAALLGGTIPQTMNYQGFLRNPDGSLTTGSYTITARIYELAAPSEGEPIFYTTTVPNVTVREGLFNIVLGDDPALPPAAFSDAPRYIGISLNGDPELIPRQRLHAVPWALTATTLVDDASVNGLSSNGTITLTGGSGIVVEDGDIDATGNLTVSGSIDATGNLTVSGSIDATGSLTVGGDIAADGKVTSEATADGDADTTVTTKGYVDTKWPDGPYCILRGGTYSAPAACPAGFNEGWICFDTEDSDNRDKTGGVIGASRIGAQSVCGTGASGSIRLELCCKD